MALQPLFIEGCTQWYDPLQVIPFGDLRVKASLPLSEAYRSLARPSSPAGAKAFTMCSNLLDAIDVSPKADKILLSTYLSSLLKRPCSLNLPFVQFSKNLRSSQHSFHTLYPRNGGPEWTRTIDPRLIKAVL